MRRLVLFALMGLSAVPAQAGLLGSIEVAREGPETTGRWSAMLARAATPTDPCVVPPVVAAAPAALELPLPAAGAVPTAPACHSADAAVTLHAVTRAAASLPLLERLQRINAAVNARPYVTDKANYTTDDYWATLDEFAARGGDCEDFAIAKYMLLKEAGVAPEKMRVTVVLDTSLGQPHAILSVEVDGTHYILDNQVTDIVPDVEATDYQPVYSVNERGWWLYQPS